MKYTVEGFRPLYHNFCIFPLEGTIKQSAVNIPGFAGADGVLVYGYYDREAGFSLEVLCCVKHAGDHKFALGVAPTDTRTTLRIRSVEDIEYSFFAYGTEEICERFKEKIEALKSYEVAEDIEKSRMFDFLDEFRDKEYIDDVKVTITKDGLNPEECMVRITNLGENCFVGSMLSDPEQDFDYHKDDKIAFYYRKDESGNSKLVSNMTPTVKLTAEELEDGSMLRDAIKTFNADKSKENYFAVLELLRDSMVWIPCKRLVPDIMKSGEKYYFPVFSSEEEMGEYGEHFTRVNKSFIDAISVARSTDIELQGIVVDAFTESLVVDATLYDMVEKLKSRL